MLGLKHTTVKLVPYSYKWSYLFQEEVINLRRVLNNRTLQVEHVGSTALDNIAAKPILDMFIPCMDLATTLSYEVALSTLGYKLVTDAANYKLYIKGSEEARTHHLTFTSPEGEYWNETIQFRDYLLNHPKVAKAYEAEKIKLAKLYATSRRNYTVNKAKFIRAVLRQISYGFYGLENKAKAELVAINPKGLSAENTSPLSLLSTYVNPKQPIIIKQEDIEGFVNVSGSKPTTLVTSQQQATSK